MEVLVRDRVPFMTGIEPVSVTNFVWKVVVK